MQAGFDINVYLKKLASGSLPEQELAHLQEILDQLTPEQAAACWQQQQWDAFQLTENEATPERQLILKDAWERWLQKVNAVEPFEQPAIILPLQPKWWKRNSWLYAACTIGVLMVTGLLLVKDRHHSSLVNTPVAQKEVKWLQLETAAGERRSFIFPDGTKLYLNGDSKVEYPARFSDSTRNIKIDKGEVYLDVRRDKAHPFVIGTGDIKIRVLGTSFSIRNRPGEKDISVAVRTGKVTFYDSRNNQHQLLLLPGFKGIYQHKDQQLLQLPVPIDDVAGWMRNEFMFEDATLLEILQTLHYSYGLQYKLEGSSALSKKRFKATFRNRSVSSMLQLLSRMGDFIYYKRDSVFIIH
ncbi:hypothetical protein A4D02_32800 [Niastella koreensis]|uniref:Anti-FecI sigma factor, FecR n=2 Tax=Niastella koreensis TaxID=354356 RepID=G8T7G8_NIAKG|nr:FecR domain-containing protein [Niastella koreensis]AEW01204.1 anti-FecI sigma factor, FecR [Niastella koreensis GR20-10]OQP45972.1 hypothetical protein A4D02_32800 [Niastella koreensis]